MSLRLFASWDFERIGAGVMSVDDDGPLASVTFASGQYCHVSISSVVSSVSLFSTVLKSSLDSASTGAGTYTVTFDETTQKYTISYSSGNFDMSFSGTSGTVMKNILGFTGNKTGASSYTSDVAVYYAIDGSIGAKTDPEEYEPPEIAEVGVADDGTTYGISRTAAPMLYDCMIGWEPVAIVRTYKAAASKPWTWQMFFAHVRAHAPFVLKDSALSENTVHKLRADGVAFNPKPVASNPSFVSYYHIQLRTFLLGRA